MRPFLHVDDSVELLDLVDGVWKRTGTRGMPVYHGAFYGRACGEKRTRCVSLVFLFAVYKVVVWMQSRYSWYRE